MNPQQLNALALLVIVGLVVALALVVLKLHKAEDDLAHTEEALHIANVDKAEAEHTSVAAIQAFERAVPFFEIARAAILWRQKWQKTNDLAKKADPSRFEEVRQLGQEREALNEAMIARLDAVKAHEALLVLETCLQNAHRARERRAQVSEHPPVSDALDRFSDEDEEGEEE